MAKIFESKFEDPTLAEFNAIYLTPEVTPDWKYSGNYSLRLNEHSERVVKNLSPALEHLFVGGVLFFPSLPPENGQYVTFMGTQINGIAVKIHNKAGVPKWGIAYSDGSVWRHVEVDTPLPQPNTVYYVVLEQDRPNKTARLWVNEQLILEVTETTGLMGQKPVSAVAWESFFFKEWFAPEWTGEHYIDDVYIGEEYIPLLPPSTYEVMITTGTAVGDLLGVPITIDDTTYPSPVDVYLPAGMHTIKAADTYAYGGKTYYFVAWSDGDKSSTKTINLQSAWGADILYGEAPPETHVVTFQSTPIAVTADINGTPVPSGGSVTVPLATAITVTVPAEVTV